MPISYLKMNEKTSKLLSGNKILLPQDTLREECRADQKQWSLDQNPDRGEALSTNKIEHLGGNREINFN